MSLRSHQNTTLINKLRAITFSTPHRVEKAADTLGWQSKKNLIVHWSAALSLCAKSNTCGPVFLLLKHEGLRLLASKSHTQLAVFAQSGPSTTSWSEPGILTCCPNCLALCLECHFDLTVKSIPRKLDRLSAPCAVRLDRSTWCR